MNKCIFALTPSPALDLGGSVDGITPNEKSYVYDKTISPGGNAINAARILSRLKVPVLASGFLGGNIGKEIKSLLDQEGVKNRFAKIDGHSRICVTVSNRADHKQTRLTFPGPDILKNEKAGIFRIFETAKAISLLMIGGSLPKGFKATDVLHLMRMAKARKIDCIVDCPGHVLRHLISGKPLLIKPNLTEFMEATQSSAESIRQVHNEATKLLDMVPFVCVSSVEGGTLLVTRNASYFGRIPRVKILSTVGAGDSMVGAMAAQIYKGLYSEEDLLRWGLAAAAATLTQPGTAFGSAHGIRHFYRMTKVKRFK